MQLQWLIVNDKYTYTHTIHPIHINEVTESLAKHPEKAIHRVTREQAKKKKIRHERIPTRINMHHTRYVIIYTRQL